MARRFPSEIKPPNAATNKAMAELEAGKGERFRDVKALMADLRPDDYAGWLLAQRGTVSKDIDLEF